MASVGMMGWSWQLSAVFQAAPSVFACNRTLTLKDGERGARREEIGVGMGMRSKQWSVG